MKIIFSVTGSKTRAAPLDKAMCALIYMYTVVFNIVIVCFLVVTVFFI
jgi:hypothetical protein